MISENMMANVTQASGLLPVSNKQDVCGTITGYSK